MNEPSDGRYEHWKERLRGTLQFLPDKPEETVDSTLRSLWCTACGCPVSAERASAMTSLPDLDRVSEEKLASLVAQRIQGKPLAHLTGRQSFLGMELLCTDQALIPRKETELLARTSLEVLRQSTSESDNPRVIDVCTGCGNIALALACHVANVRVFACDLSAAAVTLAERNAEHLGISASIEFRVGDFLAPFDTDEFHGTVSMITCNPPYISSSRVDAMDSEIHGYEPRLAFDGGPLGVRILLRLLTEAPRFLVPGGWLCFEVGAGQGPLMAKRVAGTGWFKDVKTVADQAGIPRVVAARRSEC
jgi:release factor glutamine methyltransferase